MKIKSIIATEIYDSRGHPTIQCELYLTDGRRVISSVPSGKSVGSHECIEIRDGGTRLFGLGVQKAIENIEHKIAPMFIGYEPQAIEMDLKMIELDKSYDKSYLGTNSMLAVSQCIYRAEALINDLELYEFIALTLDIDSVSLPFPFLNLINGGLHANNGLSIQEFMIVPVGATNFRTSFETGVIIYKELGKLLEKEKKSVAVGDEGGYAPVLKNDEEALDILFNVVELVSEKTGITCVLALDAAATKLYDTASGLYNWQNKKINSDELLEIYQSLIKKYPIYCIEDGFAEDDWLSWQKLTKSLTSNSQIVADDLAATNIFRIDEIANLNAANSIIIKPNQIGTITETLQAIKLCKNRQLNTIISHRSGDTCDSFIADLAVGSAAGQIKAGAPCRSERLSKYNRLLSIEDKLIFETLDA